MGHALTGKVAGSGNISPVLCYSSTFLANGNHYHPVYHYQYHTTNTFLTVSVLLPGLQFWKQNSMKVYAVSSHDISTPLKCKRNDDIQDEFKDATSTLNDMKGNWINSLSLQTTPRYHLVLKSCSCKICRDTTIKPPVMNQECVGKCKTPT